MASSVCKGIAVANQKPKVKRHVRKKSHSTTLSIINMSPKAKNVLSTDALTPKAQSAQVHELNGFALIALPPTLRTILGDQKLVNSAAELASLQITTIVREDGLVVYVNLPVKVLEIETPDFDITKSGMTLREFPLQTADSEEFAASGSDKKPTRNTRKDMKGRTK